jgi:hypothetical protein
MVALALLVSSQIAYGMPFGELTSAPPRMPGGITESTTLLLLGVAMLLFARTAKRRAPAAN